jgi:hypothetical protein
MGAGRIAEARAVKRLHRLENLFPHRRRGGVVEIDGIWHGSHLTNLREALTVSEANQEMSDPEYPLPSEASVFTP